MKSFKSPQRVIIIFLTLFIMLCCFLIVRLEIKAANLQSRWNEHQQFLNKNMDLLDELELFSRSTKKGEASFELMNDVASMRGGKNFISIGSLEIDGRSDSDIKFGGKKPYIEYFGYDSKSKSTFMRGVGNGNVFVRSNNGENYLRITDDMVSMNTWDKNKRMAGLDIIPAAGRVHITTGDNRADITLEQEDIFINGKSEINMEGKVINMENSSGKCKIKMADDDIQIVCTPSKGPIFGISFSHSSNSIDIDVGDASIILAQDKINFEAEGDINITSKNGNVNIKGKKVKVNE